MRQKQAVWLVMVCLLISPLEIWGDWELKLRGGRGDRTLTQVHFITPEQGWAIGGDTAFSTEDGGETWTRRNLDLTPNTFFVNPIDGWQAHFQQGQWNFEGTYPPIGVEMPFERSLDGGLTWTLESGTITEVVELTPPPEQKIGDEFHALAPTFFFLDAQTGFATGSTVLYGFPDRPDSFRAFYIGKTTDGGETWKLHVHWGNWGFLGGSITHIEFSGSQNGWILASSPTILYQTHDGGQTWQHQMFLRMPYSIAFSTPQEGWMCTSEPQSGIRGEVWRSRDGGRTWEVAAETHGGFPSDIMFMTPDEGWMVLRGKVKSPELGLDSPFSGILHTVDGEENWKVELDITSDEQVSVQHLNYDMLTQTLWVSGGFETLYKRVSPTVGVSPHAKLVLTWGQLKQLRKE